MFYKELLEKSVKYYDSTLIALILSLITIPSFWYLSHGNIVWILSCATLWALGVFTIFQPMIRYIYPFMITQIGTISLTFILSIISIFLNISLIFLLLPREDMEIIINNTIFSSSISNLFLFLWLYIIISGVLLSNLDFRINNIYKKPKQILYRLSSNFAISDRFIEHFIEIGFIFVLPIILLFWTEITYSFRLLLGIISIIIGLIIYFYNLEDKKNRLLTVSIYASLAFVVNLIVIESVGLDSIPNSNITARIQGENILANVKEAKDISYPSFQLSNNPKNGITTVYHIVASIPQIGLHIGHKVGTIPNKEIIIEATNSQYTISDQYNNKRFMTLDR